MLNNQHKNLFTSNTADKSLIRSLTCNENWLDVIECPYSIELSRIYTDICQSENTQKWILMINPKTSTLQKLSTLNKVDCDKVLNINAKKTNINVGNVSKVLAQGNCEKVVICNPKLSSQELKQLQLSASYGKTKCIILNTDTVLH